MSRGSLELVLIAQFVLVSGWLLRAQLRARSMRVNDQGASSVTESEGAQMLRGPEDRGDRAERAADLEALDAERRRLERMLARMREEYAREAEILRHKQREALLEIIAHRRTTMELEAGEPMLIQRLARLQVEVAHLERRRDALTDEVAASIRTSRALRERILRGRPELEVLRKDYERLHRCLVSDRDKLHDLARRRSVVQAETEALAAELQLLQRLVDQPLTLARLSDGELRESATRRRGTRTPSAAERVRVEASAPGDPAPAGPGPRTVLAER